MSLANHSDLQSAISTWMDRTDLAGVVDDFIGLAEARHRREFRLADQEDVATITLTEGAGDLPADYLEYRSVRLNTNPSLQLAYMTPDKLFGSYADCSGVGANFTIRGSKVIVRPIPSTSIELTYYRAFGALSQANPTNALLSEHPDVYLYSCLVEACAYTQDQQSALVYEAKYQEARRRAQASDKSARWSDMSAYAVGSTP